MSLIDKAKSIFTQRGGAQAAKEDAEALKDIAQGPGSTTDKAKEAFEAVKEPGAPDREEPAV
jgi:hypothetical protein